MSIAPFEPGAALARISSTPTGWIVDCRSPFTAQHYDFATEGETAEFAHLLAHEGGWQLRFSPAAEVVRDLVAELGDGGEQ